tara:strand:- start:40 stop:807 length:768 start_codon:yes stop_codon:yes gene_type:complete
MAEEINLVGKGAGMDDFLASVSESGGLNNQNLYQVILPNDVSTKGLNKRLSVLCTSISLPQRNPTFLPRAYGTRRTAVVGGYSQTDVSMTFLLLGDLAAQRYFKSWQKKIFNPETHEMGYYQEYVRDLTITQFKKPVSFPIIKKKLFDPGKIPSSIRSRLPSLGGLDLSQGEFTLNTLTKFKPVQEFKLIEAYPLSIDGEQGQILTSTDTSENGASVMNVVFSYREYEHEFKEFKTSQLDEGILGGLINLGKKLF